MIATTQPGRAVPDAQVVGRPSRRGGSIEGVERRSRRRIRRLASLARWRAGLTALVLAAAQPGCAINPVTGKPEFTTVSTSSEIEMGQKMALQVQLQVGMVDDPELAAYIARLGASLAEHSVRQDVSYHFQVVDMAEPNAFALPGGYVYVSRGLLALTDSEAELAGVVGHEIGHVAARHSAQRETRRTGVGVLSAMSSILGGAVAGSAGMQSFGGMADLYGAGIIASYSRDQERQADEIGQQIAGAAGYDPAAMPAFLERMGRYAELEAGRSEAPGFLDSHPPTEERVQATAHRASSVAVSDQEKLSATRAAYYSKLVGLPLGPDPAHGVLVRNRFIHPTLGYAVDFPPGWQTAARANLVAGVAPDGQGLIKLERQRGSGNPGAAASSFARANRLYLEDETSATIGGLPAFRARAQTSSDSGRLELDLTWIAHPQGVFRIISASPSPAFPRFERTYAAVAQSFHRASDRERASVVKRQLWIARARPGESLAALSQRSRNVWSVEQTAVANGLDASAPLTADQMVKIAVDLPFRP